MRVCAPVRGMEPNGPTPVEVTQSE
jgi:hypothetical protein